MNYRCPHCQHRLPVRSLYFRDISTCGQCKRKVVLGDFLAFLMAAITMSVLALTSLYVLNEELGEYFVAAGYAVAIGMAGGIVVLLLLGKAMPLKRVGFRRHVPPTEPAPLDQRPGETTAKG